ncbi:uncharacterized protein VTP21DRAFT_8916 [Calcarisporiella thermophila]|uniref:uncharacterized protein n=1 Tax=Calcarisporiella thermophila TaxID=911321 RepID=UPI00374240C7
MNYEMVWSVDGSTTFKQSDSNGMSLVFQIQTCKRCKDVKGHCDMNVPRCGRCAHANADCRYPERDEEAAQFIWYISHLLGQLRRRMRKMEQDLANNMPQISKIKRRIASRDPTVEVDSTSLPEGWKIRRTNKSLILWIKAESAGNLQKCLQQMLGPDSPSHLSYFTSSPRSPRSPVNSSTTSRRQLPQLQYNWYQAVLSSERIAFFRRLYTADTPVQLPAPLMRDKELMNEMASLLRCFFRCHFTIGRLMDAPRCMRAFREGKMNEFILWSALAWSTCHVHAEHPEIAVRFRSPIARTADQTSKMLMEELFDKPSLSTVIGFCLLYTRARMETGNPTFIHLARQHFNLIRDQPCPNAYMQEQFNRVRWMLSLVEHEHFLLANQPDQELELFDERKRPTPYAHEIGEYALYVECAVYTGRLYGILRKLMLRRAEGIEPETLAVEAEHLLSNYEKLCPSPLRKDVLHLSREYSTALAALAIFQELDVLGSYIEFFLPVLVSASKLGNRALAVCMYCVRRIVDLVELRLSWGVYCGISKSAAPLFGALDVLNAVLYEEWGEVELARKYLWKLRHICCEIKIPVTLPVLQRLKDRTMTLCKLYLVE